MNTRNTLLGLTAVVLVAGGTWWYLNSTPSEVKPAPVAPKTAEATPAPKVAAPIAPSKSAVAAPVAPPVAAPVSAKPTANPTPAHGTDPELTTTINDFITTLESQDVRAFVQNYIVPNMGDLMKETSDRIANDPSIPAEAKAQIEQQMQAQLPQMVDQMTTALSSRPDAMQGFQKMATALRQADAPQMNDAGDRATYNLNNNGDKDLPPSIAFVRKDGKWTLDLKSMSGAGL